MEPGAAPRKRKRSIAQSVVTYNCPGGRTFARVFKETSIEDCKRVVRAKLKLPDDTQLHLAHVRLGKVIDLDDDDDFAAFQTGALNEPALEVLVTIPSEGLDTPLPAGESLESGESASKRRKINPGDSQTELTHDVSTNFEALSSKTRTRLKKIKSIVGEDLPNSVTLLEEPHSTDLRGEETSSDTVLQQSKPKKKVTRKKPVLVDHPTESAEVANTKKKRARTTATRAPSPSLPPPPDESTSSVPPKMVPKSVAGPHEPGSIVHSSISSSGPTIPTVEEILAAFNMRDTSMDDELVDVEPEPMTQPVKKKRRTKEKNVPKSVDALELNTDSNARSGSPQGTGEIGMSTASNNEDLVAVHSDEPAKPLKRKLKKKSETRDSTSKSVVINHENNPERGVPPSVIDGSDNRERSGSSKKKLRSSKLQKSQEALLSSPPDPPELLDHAGGEASSPFHDRPYQSPQPPNLSAVPNAPDIGDPINGDVAEDVSGNVEGENDWRVRSEKQKQTMRAKRPSSSFRPDKPRLSRSKSRATSQGEAPASIANRIPTPALQLDLSDTEPRSPPHIVLPQGRRSDVSIESPDAGTSSEDEDSARHEVGDEGVSNHGGPRISPPGAVDLAALLRPRKPRRAALVIPPDDENAKFDTDEDSGSELARSTPSDVEKLRDRRRRKSSRVFLDLHPLSRRHSSSTSEGFDSPGESVIASGGEEDYRSIHDSATEDAPPNLSFGEYEMKPNGHEVEAVIDPIRPPTHHGAQDARISVPQDLVRQAESSFVQLASVPDSQISQDGGDDAFAEALDRDEQAEQVALTSQSLIQGQIGDRRINGSGRDVVDFIDLDVEIQTSNKGPSQGHPETVKSIGSSHRPPKTSPVPQTPERSLSPIQPASPWSQPDPDPRPLFPPVEATAPPSPKRSAQALNISRPRRGIVEVLVPPRSPSRPLVPTSQPSASAPVKRGPGRPRLTQEEKTRRKEEQKLQKQPSKAFRNKAVVDRSKSEGLEASDSKVEKAAALASGSRQTMAAAHPLSTAWTVLRPSTPSSPFPPSVESQAVDELHSSSPSMLSPRIDASFSQIDELISEFAPSPKHVLPEKETSFVQGASSPRIPKVDRPSNGLLPKTMRATSNGISRDEGTVELSLITSTSSPAVSPQEDFSIVDVVSSSTHATGIKEGVMTRSKQSLGRPSLPSTRISHPEGSAIPSHLGVSSRKNSRNSLPSLRDLTIDTVRSAQPSSKPSTPGPTVASSQVLRRLTLQGDEEEEEEEEETDDDDSDDNPAPASQIPENRRAGAGIVQRAVRSLGATFFST